MKMGVHGKILADACLGADSVWAFVPEGLSWDMSTCFSDVNHFNAYFKVDDLIESLAAALLPNDHVVIMSNGAFGGIHQKLLARL